MARFGTPNYLLRRHLGESRRPLRTAFAERPPFRGLGDQLTSGAKPALAGVVQACRNAIDRRAQRVVQSFA